MKSFLVLVFFFAFTAVSAAQQNEYYFKFKINEQSDLYTLSRVISIDNVNGNEIYAYANDKEMKDFLKLGYFYEMLPNPGTLINPRMSGNIDEIMDWDVYPTYEGYVAMMNQFAASYPNLCRIVNAGPTVQGRSILFAVISDNVAIHEAEPQFMYTSSMHGDETTGYVLMLRLIDYLLTNYNTDPKVTNLVNNMEIWINPLANPDGTYRGGNGSVTGAWRYNANQVDLNRNFPPTDNWNSGTMQMETADMVNLAIGNHFVMSCNFHGGAEVVNYPWDAWSRLTADNNWWVYVCRQYADTVHVYAPSGYMNGFNNGITNGYAWYYVGGGRQDYMTYFRRGRECTIELSDTKLLPPTQLPAHWNYNYRSFLNYMQKALYGITGTVTDSVTNLPLKAKVTIAGYDMDSSEVYSDSLFGKYYRLIYGGTYNLTFTAPGYYSKTVNSVYVKNDSSTIRNVQLRPTLIGITQNGNNVPGEYKLYQNYPNPFNPTTKIKFDIPPSKGARGMIVRLAVYDILGREITILVKEQLTPGSYEVEWNASNYPSGVYFYKMITGDFSEVKKMVLLK
jgi:Zinc carboxypeptidase/Secretion system C-terminal sorting domain